MPTLICTYCQKPISDDEEVMHPYVKSDAVTHVECAQLAAMEEVEDTYNEEGASGLKQLDAQADLNALLEK